MISLLLDTELTEEQRRFAEVVRSSGESLVDLINDILDFSKIEADRLELESLDFNLHDALDAFIDLMAVRAQEKGLEFICSIDPNAPAFLRGDPGRLRQILINLTGNAIKFTEQGEVAVRIHSTEVWDDQVKLHIEVRDTGIGVPLRRQDQLFEAFNQLDASTTRKYGGTGLGLAITKRLVEMMNGEIGVESVEGQGSTFWCSVILEAAFPADESDASMKALADKRVLIIDDNRTNREVLQVLLSSWKMDHAEAESADRALRLLSRAAAEGRPFHAALVDMQMPGMNGESLGRAVKAIPDLKDTVLIMMSSMSTGDDSRRIKDIGFSACLYKPLKQSQLKSSLLNLLSGQAPAEAQAPQPEAPSSKPASGLKVLLVEDNRTNQQVAVKILQNLGHQARVAGNGLEALSALENNDFDLVFMDVQMPEMDGLEATRAIRGRSAAVRDPNIPIIAMTAHAMKGDRERCLAAGMDDYLSKPFTPESLSAAVARVISPAADKAETMPPAEALPGQGDFDRGALLSILEDDQQTVEDMIAIFTQDAPLHLAGLKEAAEAGDWQAARDLAHKLKGAAGMIQARTLRNQAEAAEQAAAEENGPEVKRLHQELLADFDRFQNAARFGDGRESVAARRILIVEADPGERERLKSQLEGEGFQTAALETGDDVLTALNADDGLDLVLLDMNASGAEAVSAAVREAGRFLPIIAMTDHFDPQDESRLQAGVSDACAKPVQVDQVKGMLAKWVGDPA
jgi:CheY-like chemotaxis protein